jgi:hypothetical protein
MLVRPRFSNFDAVDRLPKTAAGDDGDGKPFEAVHGLDAIAVVPMSLDELSAVIDHVFVASPDQVEKALPGNVTGLDDANAHVLATFTGSVYSPSMMKSPIIMNILVAARPASRQRLSAMVRGCPKGDALLISKRGYAN